ncbi:hypothetical protein Pvag_pPag30322 (plasmid) [Pantoea vagans C9-1]|nr:hypothetical protein Pvag_pPag30322 [Pantoea vagans C9-1]
MNDLTKDQINPSIRNSNAGRFASGVVAIRQL